MHPPLQQRSLGIGELPGQTRRTRLTLSRCPSLSSAFRRPSWYVFSILRSKQRREVGLSACVWGWPWPTQSIHLVCVNEDQGTRTGQRVTGCVFLCVIEWLHAAWRQIGSMSELNRFTDNFGSKYSILSRHNVLIIWSSFRELSKYKPATYKNNLCILDNRVNNRRPFSEAPDLQFEW